MNRHKTSKAILFGTTGQAEVFDYLLTHDSEYEVVAFTCSAAFRQSDTIYGRPLVDFEDIELRYPPSQYAMHVALGYNDRNKLRERFYHEAKAKGYRLLTYVSSRCTNYAAAIGDNCFVLEDNTLQPFVTLGNNIVLWSGNHVGHHSTIEDHVFMASHVVVSGYCRIGANSFVGVNCTLRDGTSIGKDNVLGAGCLIVKDTPPGTTWIGHKATLYQRD